MKEYKPLAHEVDTVLEARLYVPHLEQLEDIYRKRTEKDGNVGETIAAVPVRFEKDGYAYVGRIEIERSNPSFYTQAVHASVQKISKESGRVEATYNLNDVDDPFYDYACWNLLDENDNELDIYLIAGRDDD